MIIRRIYNILGNVYYTEKVEAFENISPANQGKIFPALEEFSRPFALEIEEISINAFFYSETSLFVEGNFMEDITLEEYLTNIEIEKNMTFEDRLNILDVAAEKILSIIKYLFAFSDLNEHLFSWRKTLLRKDDKWIECIDRRKTSRRLANPFIVVDPDTITTIQNLISNDIRPFYALKFLHKAKNETNIRDKWIYAATGAELGMKEFLFIKNPNYQTKWKKSSPTIAQIFGIYYKKEVGSAFPFEKEIIKNSSIRNKIIHRPYSNDHLNYKDCLDYVDIVEKSLFHLMLLVYPGDPVLQERYDNVKNDLTVAS